MPSSSIGRIAVLVGALACSLPFATSAAHVRGGQYQGACTNTGSISDTPCLAQKGQSCGGNKETCTGCPLGRFPSTQLTALCTGAGGTPCGGAGCVASQSNSQLSGTSCVAQNCPPTN